MEKQPIFVDEDGKKFYEGDNIVLDPSTKFSRTMTLVSYAGGDYYNLMDSNGTIHWVAKYRIKNQK